MNIYSTLLPVFLLRGSGKLGDPVRPAGTARGGAGGRYGMNRVYGEPVEVQARADGRPLRFVWRSRLYTVRAILEHWVINREWWRDPGGSGPSAEPRDSGDSMDSGQLGDPGSQTDQPELEFWRVEAAPGPGMTPGVYELRQEPAAGTWTLRHN
jgi:hypothetical protein